jgi:hypothetical protein
MLKFALGSTLFLVATYQSPVISQSHNQPPECQRSSVSPAPATDQTIRPPRENWAQGLLQAKVPAAEAGPTRLLSISATSTPGTLNLQMFHLRHVDVSRIYKRLACLLLVDAEIRVIMPVAVKKKVAI